jgi:hypothetical protein
VFIFIDICILILAAQYESWGLPFSVLLNSFCSFRIPWTVVGEMDNSPIVNVGSNRLVMLIGLAKKMQSLLLVCQNGIRTELFVEAAQCSQT